MKYFQLLIISSIFFCFSLAYATGWNNGGFIEAEGVIYPEPGESINDMRRTAILEAYRYLAEEVDNLHIDSETTIRKSRREDDVINSKVETVLRGAKVTSVHRDSDGAFHAVVRLPIYGSSQSLASALLPENREIEEFPKPKYANMESGNFDKIYTGLIVDCRGLNLNVAISPVLKSATGEKIYSYENIPRQVAVDKGIVDYSDKLDSEVQRAGTSPLIIKAIKISSECDAVVSQEDADKILIANQTSKFLNNCSVVFVR